MLKHKSLFIKGIFYIHYSNLEAQIINFSIVCLFIVNELYETDLWVFPLINKGDNIYSTLLLLSLNSLFWILPSEYFSIDPNIWGNKDWAVCHDWKDW